MYFPLINNGKRWLIRHFISIGYTGMNAHDKREMMTIAKNTGVSIGLFSIMAFAIFWGGRALGSMEERVKAHEDLEAHEGTKTLFVPKGEVDLQFESVQRQLNELKAGQKEILEELKTNN